MVKGWADHCSSDEESDGEFRQHVAENARAATDTAAAVASPEPTSLTRERKPKEFVFPDAPPYVAYVGNLSYDIKSAEQLAKLLIEVAKETLGVDIVIQQQRLVADRRDPNKPHRGFGYVHVETLEMLQELVKLHDVIMAGRKLQLDTANELKNNGSNVDGSKFRGGKYKKGRGKKEDLPPKERTALKLQPRSKPVTEGESNGGSQSNIFGGAKARDEESWQDRRRQEREERRKANKDKKKEKSAPKKPTPTPAVPAPAPKKEKVVTNSFAALGFDSDSD